MNDKCLKRPARRDDSLAQPKLLIIRHCGNAHRHYCRYLVEEHGFRDLCRIPYDPGAKTKVAHFKDLAGDLLFAIRHLRLLRSAQEIVSTGPMAAAVALLLKLGLLPQCHHVWWFGLFIHNPRWMRILRHPFRLLNCRRMRYVVFSRFETTLYVRGLGLDAEQLRYVPYGQMGSEEPRRDLNTVRHLLPAESQFFFSGGASSRDYPTLIETFRELPFRLIIVCGFLNRDVPDSGLPRNVTVYRDLPFEMFEALAQVATACIVPIAHDTGAAGQSVILSHMRQGKIIIATDTSIIREYIQNGVSGILVKNNREPLAEAVRTVAAEPATFQQLGDAAYTRYVTSFSRKAVARQLTELVDGEMLS